MTTRSPCNTDRTGVAKGNGRRAAALLLCLLAVLGGCTKSAGGQVRDSVTRLEQERKPDRLVRAGEAFASVGDATRASQYFAMAIESGGDETLIFPRLLETCIRDKQYRAAAFHAENYLRKHPADTSLRFVVGTLHAAMGDTKMAKEQFQEVLRATPKNSEVCFALAVLYRDGEGDRASADPYFRQYLELEPRGQHAEEARGSLLKAMP